jgi:hypothetical protein
LLIDRNMDHFRPICINVFVSCSSHEKTSSYRIALKWSSEISSNSNIDEWQFNDDTDGNEIYVRSQMLSSLFVYFTAVASIHSTTIETCCNRIVAISSITVYTRRSRSQSIIYTTRVDNSILHHSTMCTCNYISTKISLHRSSRYVSCIVDGFYRITTCYFNYQLTSTTTV